ncbi:MAG TPA: T9SS type A sorting domain-containing protein [Candidatus Kapabacteria bacterium]|nr:T9SS type A sorting domain-containing protein [Candidatus Kapabacteria bacterium]
MKRSILSFAIALSALLSLATAQAQTIYWHKTGGPQGGAVGDISADSSGRVWISVLRDGAWFSDDHGNTWDSISKGLPSPNVKWICASNDGYVYAVKLQQDWVYRLNTNVPKDQWIWEDITPVKGISNSISCIITTQEGYVVLGTGLNQTDLKGAVISKDRGNSWSSLAPTIGNANFVARGKNGEYAIYQQLPSRSVWVTQDDGANWTKLADPVPTSQIVTTLEIARQGQNARTIVVGTKKAFSGNPNGGQIFSWFDTSTVWTKSYQGPTNPQGGKNDDHIDDIIKVHMKNPNPDILYACYHGRILRSGDLGYTWTVQDSVKKGDEPFQMTAEKNDAGDTYLYQESEPDGIHRSIDHGVTWVEQLNAGLNFHLMYGGGIDTVSAAAKASPKGEILYGVIEFGLITSTDAGATWTGPEEFGQESYTNTLIIAPDGTPVAGTDAGIFISRDHGKSVELVKEVLSNANGLAIVRDSLFHRSWVYATFQNAFLRAPADSLDQWRPAPTTGMDSTDKLPWGIAGNGNNLLIAGTPAHYYQSNNAGETWSAMTNTPISSGGVGLNPVKMIIHTDGSYISYSSGAPANGGGAWRSSDGGNSWAHIFPPELLGAPLPTDFYGLNNDSKGTIFVCSDSGLWRSNPGDQSYQHWTNVGGGLYFDGLEYTKKQVNVAEVVENRVANTYYAFARGLSVWESTTMGGVRLPFSSASKNPSVIGYPNPFISSTTLQFELKEASQVHIEVLDVMGRVVANIPTSYFDSGKHTVSFEAGSLETGNYMVVLRAGETTQTGWITLTK